jgi:hypothetical protein
MIQFERAERRWSGPCIVAASGPSLTPEVAALCDGTRTIAVNDAYQRLPAADVLYACDIAWWTHHRGCPNFRGEKWTSHSLVPKNNKIGVSEPFGLRVIPGADNPGFSLDPVRIHYGNNSGFQAINLAILWGADPIVLVGFDMRPIDGRTHFFGEHKAPLRPPADFRKWIGNFRRAAEMHKAPPVILNATPGSALDCFPMVDLREELFSWAVPDLGLCDWCGKPHAGGPEFCEAAAA